MNKNESKTLKHIICDAARELAIVRHPVGYSIECKEDGCWQRGIYITAEELFELYAAAKLDLELEKK